MKDLEKLSKTELIAEIRGLQKIQKSLTENTIEKKAVEIKLKLSENYLHSIINNVSDPVFVKDDHSKLLLVNDAFCSIFDLSRDQIIGKTLAEDVPDVERERFLSVDKQVLSDGIESNNEESLTIRGGKTKIITTRKTRFIDSDGKKYLVGISHDITEQKEAKEELKESIIREQLMADIVRESVVGIAIGYPDGRLGMSNAAFQNITGYNEQELKSIDWNKKLTPPEWEESESAKLQELHSTKKAVKYEKEYIKKDGSRVPIELIVNPRFNDNGEVEYYFAFVIDITERKLAEEIINLSNQRYKSLFNDSPIPLWEEDFTELVSYLLKLKEKGHKDLRNYFENNPNELLNCAGMVKILDVNQAALDLHKAKSKEQLIGNLSETFTESSFTVFKNELLAVFEEQEIFESEAEVKTLQGDLKNIYITLKVDRSQPGKVKVLLATSDITERKQAQQLVLKNTIKLDYALRSIETGAWELDLKTLGAWRTLKHDQIFGYKQLLNEWTYDMFIEHIVPEDREIVNQKFQHALTTKTDWNFECRITRNNDGEIRWILAKGSQELNEQKKPIKMFGIVQDITIRKQTEEKVSESTERLNLALEAANAGLWSWNIKTGEDLLDERWCAILGYTKDEIEQHVNTWEALMHPDDKDRVTDVVKKHFEDENNEYREEYRMKCKNGEWKWIFAVGKVVKRDTKGEPDQMTGIIIDISEQKLAERKIHAIQKNLKNTFDISPSIISKANSNTGYFVEVNQAVSKMLGYSVEEFTSKPLMEFIHPDDRQRTIDESLNAQKKVKAVNFFENRYLCKNGSYKWIAWSGTKADENGIVTAIGADVHERKMAENELRKHQEHLEDLVKERTKNLEEKNKELERFNDLFVDREFRIKELKEKIKKLENGS